MSEQSGWSDLDGTHIDLIVSQSKTGKGKSIKPTIAHARLYGLIPRQSMIVNQLDKPMLIEYTNTNHVKATLESHAVWQNEYGDTDDSAEVKRFMREVVADKANEHRNDTADKGSAIHKEVERWLLQRSMSYNSFEAFSPYKVSGKHETICKRLYHFFKENKIKHIETELTFASPLLGYSGSPDIMAVGDYVYIIDMKTTDLKKFKGPYETWAWQLGGYSKHPFIEDVGLDTIFVSAVFDADTGEGYEVKKANKNGDMLDGLFVYNGTKVANGIRSFEHLYELWVLRNQYDPRVFWGSRNVPDSIFDMFPELEVK